MQHEESRPWQAGPSSDASTEEFTTTTAGPVYAWEICPAHPWFNKSVVVTDEGAYCIPPDGPYGHWVVT